MSVLGDQNDVRTTHPLSGGPLVAFLFLFRYPFPSTSASNLVALLPPPVPLEFTRPIKDPAFTCLCNQTGPLPPPHRELRSNRPTFRLALNALTLVIAPLQLYIPLCLLTCF